MLNKNQSNNMSSLIKEEARKIYRLIKADSEEEAFVKYDTMRNMVKIFELENELNDKIEYYLEKDGYDKVYFEAFKGGMIDYKTGEISTVKFAKEIGKTA